MDKVKINLEAHIKDALDADYLMFFGKERGISYNQYILRILNGIYHKRQDQIDATYDLLLSKLGNKADKKIIEDIASSLQGDLDPNEHYTLRRFISIRPRKEDQALFSSIEAHMLKEVSLSSYCRWLLQSYIKLPGADRETLLFSSIIDLIADALNEGRVLLIKRGDQYEEFKPYQLLSNDDNSFVYLVGFSSGQVHSYHIFRLADKCIIGQSHFEFSKEEIEEIHRSISEVGAAYIGRPRIEAIVEMDETGADNLDKIFHERPIYSYEGISKNDKYIFIFYGSANMIERYLTRFGEHAFVIYPKDMRTRIYALHKRAYGAYRKRLEEDEKMPKLVLTPDEI